MRKLAMFTAALALGALGCGANPYGYARTYVPAGDEPPYLSRAVELSYDDVRRFPERHAEELIGWFGLVTEVESIDRDTGEARVRLELRPHQERHLCRDETSESCRVTVSERGNGPFTALVRLRPEEMGEHRDRVWAGSLLKVYGHVTEAGTEESGPVLRVDWHRHWPHGTYVTTASRGSMRR
jgi:hypothetical protein